MAVCYDVCNRVVAGFELLPDDSRSATICQTTFTLSIITILGQREEISLLGHFESDVSPKS